MSILCSHREVSGADLIRLIARAGERELKRSLDNQEPEREEKTSYIKEIVKGIVVLIALYLGIMLIVGLAR